MRVTGATLAFALTAALAAGCGTGDGSDAGRRDASGSWTRLPDAPLSPRDHAVVVAVGDRVLVVGGWEFLCPPGADCSTPEGPLLDDGAVYDHGTGSWGRTAEAPFGVRAAEYATAALDGSAFVLTGCMDGPMCDAQPRMLSYDLADDRWTDHGAVPGPKHYRHLVAFNGKLLVYAGSDERGEVADMVFDPEGSTWTELPDDPLPRTYDRFVVPVGDQLVLAGSSSAALDAGGEAGKLAARLDMATGRWTRLPDAPGRGFQLFPSERGLLLNGHFGDSPGWILDPETWQWTELSDASGAHDDLSGVLEDDRATYDVGSVGDRARYVYDSTLDDFVTISAPTARGGVYDDSSTALGRDLFLYGGQRWTGDAFDGEGELVGEAWLWTAPAATTG